MSRTIRTRHRSKWNNRSQKSRPRRLPRVSRTKLEHGLLVGREIERPDRAGAAR